MKRYVAALTGCIALMLSVFYLMTARVYIEGSLGESYLMLKPSPSLVLEYGGGEEGAWVRANPGRPAPWWQSADAIKLASGGDWEDPALWTSFHMIGYFLTPIIWAVFVVLLLRRKKRSDQNEL